MLNVVDLSESELERLECIQNASEVPLLLFWIGAVGLTWYIAKQNKFGPVDAILAAIGLKKFPRTPPINALNILVVFVPLVLAVYAIQVNCGLT